MKRLTLLCSLLLLVLPVARAEETPSVTPDLDFYKERVAPIVHGNCAECHADPRKRLGRHFVRPRQGLAVSDRDHERNYRTILRLLVPGNPAGSTWLLKALGTTQGGVEHGGNARIRFDSLEYAAMVDFINGVKLTAPTATPSGPPPVPEVGAEGLTLGVDDLALEGDASVDPGDGVRRWIDAGAAGGAASARFRLPVDGTWLVELDVVGPGTGTTWRIDGGSVRGVAPAGPGLARVGSPVLLDGIAPVAARSGRPVLRDGRVALAGAHGAPSAFVLPEEVRHTRVEATVRLPAEEDGGDDALLLFDMEDLHNGKFAGLVDGGRRFAMGLLEGGTPRVITTAPAAPPREPGPRRLEVVLLEGVAVGRLDGRAITFLHLDRHLRDRAGRFGVRTHGALEVESVAAFERFEVHRAAFREASAVRLAAGTHALRIALPPGAPGLVSAIIRPLVE